MMTIGWVTLDVGEQALVFNHQGEARVEQGPTRIFLFRERLEHLSQFIANQNEFLVIKYTNGTVEHKPGPLVMYKNPLDHDSITVKTSINLDANEVLVVYRQDEATQKVSRYILHGPTIFVPSANEWLHEFCWHGTDPENKTRKIPGQMRFTKLQVIPDQFYYNVDEVRTADDALMRVKLMLFYELKEIEQMLNETQDPIADFINCLCADVVAFAAKLTYMEFIERSAELNDLDHYSQLMERCKKIGFAVTKVVFRGYFASPKLQQMHDAAITSRTKLKLEYEQEEQAQSLTDMKLRSEMDRISKEQSLDLEKLEHKQQMERLGKEHELSLRGQSHKEGLDQKRQQQLAKLAAKKLSTNQELEHYHKLRDMNVDLTQYVLSLNPKPHKVIKVVASSNAASLHLHQN